MKTSWPGNGGRSILICKELVQYFWVSESCFKYFFLSSLKWKQKHLGTNALLSRVRTWETPSTPWRSPSTERLSFSRFVFFIVKPRLTKTYCTCICIRRVSFHNPSKLSARTNHKHLLLLVDLYVYDRPPEGTVVNQPRQKWVKSHITEEMESRYKGVH